MEYIPLYVETLAQGEILANDVPTGLVVMETATEAKKRVGVLLGENGSLELPDEEGYLFILACNLAVRMKLQSRL